MSVKSSAWCKLLPLVLGLWCSDDTCLKILTGLRNGHFSDGRNCCLSTYIAARLLDIAPQFA